MRNYSFSVSSIYNVVVPKTSDRQDIRKIYSGCYAPLMRAFQNPSDRPVSDLTASEAGVWKALKRHISKERSKPQGKPFVYVNVNTGVSLMFCVNGKIDCDFIVFDDDHRKVNPSSVPWLDFNFDFSKSYTDNDYISKEMAIASGLDLQLPVSTSNEESSGA